MCLWETHLPVITEYVMVLTNPVCEDDDSACRDPIAKSIRLVDRDMKFANNFISSW